MKINEYFSEYCINRSAFIRKVGISAPTLARLIKGLNVNVSTAKRVSEGTDGKVSVDDLIGKNV